jgi:hypothetical protein
MAPGLLWSRWLAGDSNAVRLFRQLLLLLLMGSFIVVAGVLVGKAITAPTPAPTAPVETSHAFTYGDCLQFKPGGSEVFYERWETPTLDNPVWMVVDIGVYSYRVRVWSEKLNRWLDFPGSWRFTLYDRITQRVPCP